MNVRIDFKQFVFSCIALMTFLSSANVQAKRCETVQIKSDYLNVRSGPGTHYPRVGRLDKGEQYVVLKTQGTWNQIRLSANTHWVYASSSYVDKMQADCAEVVNTETLNVRSGPSTSYRKVGTAPKGSHWVLISSSGAWRKIWYDGVSRWMHSYYLSTEDDIPEPPPITVVAFDINNGAANTNSQFVNLSQQVSGSQPSHYQVSESSSFGDAQWVDYSNNISFTLSAGNGAKTVYFRVKNASGRLSETVSDSIELAVPAADDRQIDPVIFFNEYRQQFGNLTQSQVDGINFIMANMEKDKDAAYRNLGVYVRQLAYLWATIKHEVANTYEPITEYGNANCPRYDGGCRYKGRGYVQLTHRYNYAAMSPIVGVDLVAEPELALVPDLAYTVMSYGSFYGVFTSRRLGSYIKEGLTDYYNARRVINGTDKASLIKGYAEKFQKVMEKATR